MDKKTFEALNRIMDFVDNHHISKDEVSEDYQTVLEWMDETEKEMDEASAENQADRDNENRHEGN